MEILKRIREQSKAKTAQRSALTAHTAPTASVATLKNTDFHVPEMQKPQGKIHCGT